MTANYKNEMLKIRVWELIFGHGDEQRHLAAIEHLLQEGACWTPDRTTHRGD